MLDDGRQGHVQGLCQFADRCRAATKPRHDGTPGGVGKRLEHTIERSRLVKHMLKYHGRPQNGKHCLPWIGAAGMTFLGRRVSRAF
jgi:hypothetical protein